MSKSEDSFLSLSLSLSTTEIFFFLTTPTNSTLHRVDITCDAPLCDVGGQDTRGNPFTFWDVTSPPKSEMDSPLCPSTTQPTDLSHQALSLSWQAY